MVSSSASWRAERSPPVTRRLAISTRRHNSSAWLGVKSETIPTAPPRGPRRAAPLPPFRYCSRDAARSIARFIGSRRAKLHRRHFQLAAKPRDIALLRLQWVINPGIENRHARRREARAVARDDRQAVMPSGRGDDEIGLREGVPRFPPLVDQRSPGEHDVFAHREDARREDRPQLVRQPIIQFRALARIADELDAESDFGKRHHADEEGIERLRGDETHDLRIGPDPAQFRQDVGVEQPAGHNSMSRTGMIARPGSKSISRWGEAWRASIRA